MEDLTVQHDGTVRDANHNIIQYHYGEDGINPTKIEIQTYSIGKLSKEEIEKQFGMEGVDWSTILKDGIIREADAELLTEYKEQLAYDKRMMVEGVFQSKALDSDAVFAPVNLARWILNVKNRFALHPTERTDLTPSYVLQGIKTIIARTHRHHKIWAGLLRFHLAPHKLIIKERFTKAAFDMLVELIVVAHMKAWVQPGDQVGIVAAQSIGEPATQMSSIGSTVICITNGSDVKYRGTVKDFMDPILKANAANLKTIGKNSVVLPMEEGDDYYIMGVSEDEKTSWHRISEMSRHPCHGGIVEVKTRTGRTTTATLSHSFLKRSPTGIVPVRGSDLEVGMRIPIARVIPEVPGATTAIKCGETTFELTREFGWICGIYLADGSFNGNNVIITKQAMVVETNLAAFSKLHGITNSVRHYKSEYGPSKSIMIPFKDLKDCLMATFGTGSYQKFVGANVFHANKEFIAGVIAGFFDGDGNVSAERQMIRAGSRCQTLIKDMTALLGYVGMYATMSEETSIRIPDKVMYTMVIPSKFAKEYKEKLGFQLPEKAKALDEIIAYNAREDAKCKQDAIDQIPELGNIIAETGKILQFPDQSRTYGRWKKKEAIGRQTLAKYIRNFEVRIQELTTQGIAIHPRVAPNMELLRSAADADVIWDEIVELIEYDDPNEFVYDFTVPGNDSFMVDCNVLVHNTLNTFHQAGVASKSAMTRGVPRLKELLKVSQNPKATSLTIHLKPEYRSNKDKAREVVQDLELTVLRNITDKVAIYWDENDADSIVEQDRELMAFYKEFEAGVMMDEKKDQKWSKWVLRLELNREEMFNRNISIQEVVYVIKSTFSETDVVYSDYNSDNLVMRIRVPHGEGDDTATQHDHFTDLKKFQNKLLNSIVIRGLPGIKAVTFQNDKKEVELDKDGRYQTIEQFVLDTDGSNFIKVMNHPAVDGTRLYSTNVWDIYDVLGIEATRAVLFQEISILFETAGGVNYRHLCLLCDVMTRAGRLMSIDRYGINKNDIGTLAKAAFEETQKILLKAALFGEVDPVTGVSANIMMGQAIRGGTAFSQVLMDDQMLPELLASVEVQKVEEEEVDDLWRSGEDPSTQIMDPCSTTQFQMGIILPNPKALLPQEEDIEINLI